MSQYFKQAYTNKRDKEVTEKALVALEHLTVGGYNVAQEGILDTLKKFFSGNGNEEKHMKEHAKSAADLLTKITALQAELAKKTGLKKDAQPIRLPKSVLWFMANDKLIPTKDFASVCGEMNKTMHAIYKSVLPTLDKNAEGILAKYLMPLMHDQFETDMDVKKVVNWQEPREMYSLMTEDGPMHYGLKMPTIQTPRAPGNWSIVGVEKPVPQYNVRMMTAELFPIKNIKPAVFEPLTKDQCVEILSAIEESLKLSESTFNADKGSFSLVELKMVKALKGAMEVGPRKGDENYKIGCEIFSLAYTVLRQYNTIYNADGYAYTAFLHIFKICEFSIKRME